MMKLKVTVLKDFNNNKYDIFIGIQTVTYFKLLFNVFEQKI